VQAGLSYYHLAWVTDQRLALEGQSRKNMLNKFMQESGGKIEPWSVAKHKRDKDYVDISLFEIDRLLDERVSQRVVGKWIKVPLYHPVRDALGKQVMIGETQKWHKFMEQDRQYLVKWLHLSYKEVRARWTFTTITLCLTPNPNPNPNPLTLR
jgi:hypothetical protein